MPKPRPKKCYAIVKKKRPVLSTLDIYDADQIHDIVIEKDEEIVKVEIRVV